MSKYVTRENEESFGLMEKVNLTYYNSVNFCSPFKFKRVNFRLRKILFIGLTEEIFISNTKSRPTLKDKVLW